MARLAAWSRIAVCVMLGASRSGGSPHDLEQESGEVGWLVPNITTEKPAVLELLEVDLLDQEDVFYELREPKGAERG